MALLPILTAPDPRLKKKSLPVETVDADVRQLMDDMLETMYDAPGIGLAAPQVGALKRVIVLDIDREETKTGPLFMANPEIVEASDDDVIYEEGCLSVPGVYEPVERAASIRVRAQDAEGQPFELDAGELLAVCIQHEMDHLEGKVFVQYLSRLKQMRIRMKMQKQARDTA